MGMMDKAKNAAQEAGGKVKESVGDATDNPNMQAEGKADQVEANIKDAADKARESASDAVRDATR